MGSALRGRPTNEAVARLPGAEGPKIGPERRLAKAKPAPGDKIAKVSECRCTMQRACRELGMPRKLDHHDLPPLLRYSGCLRSAHSSA